MPARKWIRSGVRAAVQVLETCLSTGKELREDSSRLPDGSLTGSDGHGSTKALLRKRILLGFFRVCHWMWPQQRFRGTHNVDGRCTMRAVLKMGGRRYQGRHRVLTSSVLGLSDSQPNNGRKCLCGLSTTSCVRGPSRLPIVISREKLVCCIPPTLCNKTETTPHMSTRERL